ncbi:MAG: DUF4840 domain-containing protein [Mediterranea sp.]|jgi:hypothetical protein|nr:DUF4840 domain-containing protein [Mediterranea sp.]
MKMYNVKSLMLAAMAFCLTAAFVACDNDNESSTVTLTDVNGSYAGTVKTDVAQPASREANASEPTGTEVTAAVQNDSIEFLNFPVTDLIASIAGEEHVDDIVNLLGTVDYKVGFLPSFGKSNTIISLSLDPQTLTLQYGEGETSTKIDVTVAATEAGTYTYNGQTLAFNLKVTEVKVNGEAFDFPETTFTFSLAKKTRN